MNLHIFILVLVSLVISGEVKSLPLVKIDTSPIIVQQKYIKDIYKNQIFNGIGSHVSVLTLRNFDRDKWKESKKYSLSTSSDRLYNLHKRKVFVLGISDFDTVKPYATMFLNPSCLCYSVNNKTVSSVSQNILNMVDTVHVNSILVINDQSSVSQYRMRSLELYIKKVSSRKKLPIRSVTVNNAAELRGSLVAFNRDKFSILFINAFDIIGDSGAPISYRTIEGIVTDFNTVHFEVGVYYKGHKSAYAYGPEPEDIGNAIYSTATGGRELSSKVRVRSSINIRRLEKLNLLDLTSGMFKEAYVNDQTDNR